MPIIHISLVSHAWLSRKVHSVDTQGCSVLIRRDAQPETANFVVAALLEESPCSRGGGVRRCSAFTTRHRHRCHQLWEVRPSVESGVDRAAGPRQQGRLRHIRLCHSPVRSTLLSPVLPCCAFEWAFPHHHRRRCHSLLLSLLVPDAAVAVDGSPVAARPPLLEPPPRASLRLACPCVAVPRLPSSLNSTCGLSN